MRSKLELKPLFLERMQSLFQNKKDFENYLESLEKSLSKSFRCNKLKISPKELKKRLEKKGWIVKQPWPKHKEIMVVESVNGKDLEPGELGRALEHLLGYYYIQELSSMLPVMVLAPKPKESILDLAAAPGSKTSQMASEMENLGLLIANDVSIGRIKILASNLERCGVSNCIITRKEGSVLCKRLKKLNEVNLKLDKILVDAPCSGEGTLPSSPKTAIMWNINTIKALSNLQKKLISSALEILKPGGELVYSTCTHAPEENEEVVDFILKKFHNVKLEKINLPIEYRPGITNWKDKIYSSEVKKCTRIYPQDNNTEGFFIAKFKKIKE